MLAEDIVNLTAAVQKNTKKTAEYCDLAKKSIALMDGEREHREAQVSTAITEMQSTMLMPYIGYYDGQQVTKTSLSIAADPDNNTVSQWYPVPNTKPNHFYPVEGKLTLVDLLFCYSYQPGYPSFTNGDNNWSFAQFVYAPDAATSAQINARLAAIKKMPDDAGGWWDGTSTVKAVAVYYPGLHNYSRLFVRFVNRPASYLVNAGINPSLQNIVTYGGSVPFKVEKVRHYPMLEG